MESNQTIGKKERFIKGNIELRPSIIHRYGVFATKDIAPEEIIEECPVVIAQHSNVNTRQELLNREFAWDDQHYAVALGYGSLYNHADQPNAEYSNDHTNQIIRFTATEPIFAGTEILIHYGDDWFTNRGMKVVSKEDQDKKNNSAVFKFLSVLIILLVLSQIFPANLSKLTKHTHSTNKIAQIPITFNNHANNH